MTVLLTSSSDAKMPFVLPWERIAADPASPELARLVRGTRRRRIAFAISAALFIVAAVVAVPLLALGAEGTAATIAALLLVVLFVTGTYLGGVAGPTFFQPSVIVLRHDELVAASLTGTRRRRLTTMTGLQRTDVVTEQAGMTTSQSLRFKLSFDGERPLRLWVPSKDFDVRDLIRRIEEQWSVVRRPEVLNRLAAGETVTIPDAFVRRTSAGPSWHGSISLSPAGVTITASKKAVTEIAWDRIAGVSVSDEGRLAILGRGDEVLLDLDELQYPRMFASNLVDYAAFTGSI